MQGSFPPEVSLEPVDVEQLYDSMRSALERSSGAQQGGSAWRAEVSWLGRQGVLPNQHRAPA